MSNNWNCIINLCGNNVANIPGHGVPKMQSSVPAGSRNRPTSIPAGSRNRSTYVPTGSRNRPTSVPAGSRNRPTSVPAGRPFSAMVVPRKHDKHKEKLDDLDEDCRDSKKEQSLIDSLLQVGIVFPTGRVKVPAWKEWWLPTGNE
ncbi:hypothetical protein Tco_0356538 [Tanacetum coccineum]